MTKDQKPDHAKTRRNVYGRRSGKTLRQAHKTFLEQDLAGLSPGKVGPQDNPDGQLLDLKGRFGDHPLWLEIGFGGGEHLVHQAVQNPDVEIIGCEPFINGVAMLLGKIRAAGVSNLSVYPGDVRDVLDALPSASVERAFLLYPDPWPKQRHHRRRFVNPAYLTHLARVLRPGAHFRVATDIPDYVRQTLQQVPAHGFEQIGLADADIHTPWQDWARTRYENKALREGRVPHYLTFRRLG